MKSTNIKQQNNRLVSRQSNIELLRILAMLLIVAHHFAIHGGFTFSTGAITVNRLWIQLLQMGGKVGVNVFVLISGYFLVTADSHKTGKILQLWLQLFTYSMGIFLIFTVLRIEPFSIKELLHHALPVTFSQWWFASSYFVLYLLTPYINILLNAMDKKTYQRFLALLTFCWCLIPTFLTVSLQCNFLLWFLYLYSLAGYIRLHMNSASERGYLYLLGALGIAVLTFSSVIILDCIGTKIPFFGIHATYFYHMQRLPILLLSVLFFLGFLNMNIGNKRIINFLSSATFGVYLLHDNDYMRTFLWQRLFRNASLFESDLLIPYSILVVILVYAICTAIELCRIYFVEKFYSKVLLHKLSSKEDR